jgi:hypothetical protein
MIEKRVGIEVLNEVKVKTMTDAVNDNLNIVIIRTRRDMMNLRNDHRQGHVLDTVKPEITTDLDHLFVKMRTHQALH